MVPTGARNIRAPRSIGTLERNKKRSSGMLNPDPERTERPKVKNAAFWASRTAEIRALAETTLDPDKRVSTLRTAQTYTRIAQHIAKRTETPALTQSPKRKAPPERG
jgi:hypothetical protein